jgi:hypothetical protein
MKKIVLSAVAALTMGSVALSASGVQLYSDSNGQVFTQAGEGRTAIKPKGTSVFAKADKLKFSGQAFIGYKSTVYDDYTKVIGGPSFTNEDDQSFQIRRGYLQLKAYLLDDPKSYYRITYDLKNNSNFDSNSLDVRAKYAYLNLNEVLPATSFEIGLAHRPWHDYEEHNSWLYRSISEVLIENKNSAHLSSSADYGVMAKTRTKYFDSDIGVFNGEGYHGAQNSNGMSLEWRFTGHLLGTHGHPDKNTYLDASFFGQYNQKHSNNTTTNNDDDLHFYGLHTVYNQPSLLLSAQYVTSEDTSTDSSATGKVSSGSGSGYSFNAEGRLGEDHQYKAFAKYDKWTPEVISGATEYDRITEIFGIAYKQNRNVEWIANVTVNDNDSNYYAYIDGGSFSSSTANSTSYMITAEINF